ncbi:MAG: DNA (cytosine-5)-methyltransferase 1 [Rubritalea sp.]|jgi:DNA (cytosine-5)-methyltransferase 1
MAKKSKIAVVDLFCGAGGLTHGLKLEGFNVRAGIDVDPQCRYAYEANNKSKYLLKDVSKVKGLDLKEYFNNADYTMLAGCAPCQPFSKYTQGKGLDSDGKWFLLNQFSRLIDETKPDFVTMENVPQLARHAILTDFKANLESRGYQVTISVVRCVDYGIPQSRERLVLLASRFHSSPLKLVSASRYKKKTVKETIGHLPAISAGGVDTEDKLHRSSSLSSLNQQRIKLSKAGGSWKDWPESMRASCHTQKSGQTYVSVYGRMEWDAPAPTMTTQCFGFGNGRFGHPEQHRAISLREAALFQTFPRTYKFEPEGVNLGMKALGRMIGNAVPVKLGVIVARSFQKHIKEIESV